MCRRNFLLFVCTLQLLTVIERQIFDFLGHLWLPIIINFLHMIFIIFGFFGAYQFRAKYLISYSVWNLLWIGWNAFIICFYLNVFFDLDGDILNFGTGTVSWFESNGPGCKPIYLTNATFEDPFRPIRPERVDGCFLEYPIIEVIHSGVQNFLAILGLIGAISICCSIWNDDDSFEFMGSDVKSPQHTFLHPMYVQACSYTSLKVLPANGSGSSTQLNSKKDPNQFGVVLTSVNNYSSTNSLSSTYKKTDNYPSSNIKSPLKTHHPTQMQSPTNYKLIDHCQLSSSNLSPHGSRSSLLNKSTAAQQINRNPSTNRSDIRYTEIIAATDVILNDDKDDNDTNSIKSYGRPLSQASTAAASPITSNKLMATNLHQQQLMNKSFGIHNNLLNEFVDNENNYHIDGGKNKHSINFEFHNHGQQKNQQKLFSANSKLSPPPVPRPDYNVSNSTAKSYHFPYNQISDKHLLQNYQQPCIARSPNLNRMPKRRHSQQQQQNPQQLETSHSSSKLSSPVGNFDLIREKPLPGQYNLNQFIPEYNCPNPLPAIPPHMRNPMYRVRSQDRIVHRLKHQPGQPHGLSQQENQRPRSFCNNMTNYQDYKDIQ